ncbi:MAG: hypothetical protein AAF528_01015 [Cyanobacteria bacterium P01_C01_bin.121]
MTQRPMPQRRKSQPLDRAASVAMGVLALVIVAMLLLGSQALPRVRTFSWQHQQVEATDVAFLLTFTQPMVSESVEENLVITPPLPGKFSWAGRRMAYTLEAPAPYGESFKVELPEAQALNGQDGFEPFDTTFQTRDRAFAYIGAEGEETNRLVLFNLTKKEKTILTPEDQTVLDFRPYPQRDRILFSAVSSAITEDLIAGAQLYSVTTGLASSSASPAWQFWKSDSPAVEAGLTELVLDNRNFQNLKFELAPNGESLVVQRVEQNNPSNYGPWLIQPDKPPRKIKTEPGGDFKIAPDNVSLLLQQGRGTAVIDLAPDVSTAESNSLLLDFLPEYGLTLDIADDGASAALVNFNEDDLEARFTQSLFWVSNRGEEKLLLQTEGSIVSAQFNHNNEILYCLINQLLRNEQNSFEDTSASEAETIAAESEASSTGAAESDSGAASDITEGSVESAEAAAAEGLEEDINPESTDVDPVDPEPVDLLEESFTLSPYLTAINVKTGEVQRLLEMPPQPEITVSLAPDGLAILFDEMLVSSSGAAPTENFEGATHRLWLLPLFGTPEARLNEEPTPLVPTELNLAGRHPIWLP